MLVIGGNRHKYGEILQVGICYAARAWAYSAAATKISTLPQVKVGVP